MSREAMIEAAAERFRAEVSWGFRYLHEFDFSESDMAWLLHCAARFAEECVPMNGTAAATLAKYDYLYFEDARRRGEVTA